MKITSPDSSLIKLLIWDLYKMSEYKKKQQINKWSKLTHIFFEILLSLTTYSSPKTKIIGKKRKFAELVSRFHFMFDILKSFFSVFTQTLKNATAKEVLIVIKRNHCYKKQSCFQKFQHHNWINQIRKKNKSLIFLAQRRIQVKRLFFLSSLFILLQRIPIASTMFFYIWIVRKRERLKENGFNVYFNGVLYIRT